MKKLIFLVLLIALAYSQCTLPEVQRKDESNTNICVEVVEGCDTYNSIQVGRCHDCAAGFTGSDIQGFHKTCTCDEGVPILQEDDTFICQTAAIPNCKVHLAASPTDKCHTCEAGYTGYGGTGDNAWAGCCLDSESVVRPNDAVPSATECVTKIHACETYVEGGATCSACLSGSTINGEATACTCNSGIHSTND